MYRHLLLQSFLGVTIAAVSIIVRTGGLLPHLSPAWTIADISAKFTDQASTNMTAWVMRGLRVARSGAAPTKKLRQLVTQLTATAVPAR
jgi:hypothetical protein